MVKLKIYSIPNPTLKCIMHLPYSPNPTPSLTTACSAWHNKSMTTKPSYPQAHMSTAGSKKLPNLNSHEGVRAYPWILSKCICPFVCLFVCLSVRVSVRPHGITLGGYIRGHFWDALLVQVVKIVGLELPQIDFPRFLLLYWFLS